MKVKYTTTAEGKMALVPIAEYERLKALAREAEEDAGTARLVARAKKEISEGASLIPKEVVDRLADGENPVRVLREFREETQQEFAVAIGITQGYLSDLEAGKRKGPLELHRKISRALGVPLDLLAPIAVSREEANPKRYANIKRVAGKISQQRKYRN